MDFLKGDLRSLTEKVTFWEGGEEADEASHVVTRERKLSVEERTSTRACRPCSRNSKKLCEATRVVVEVRELRRRHTAGVEP